MFALEIDNGPQTGSSTTEPRQPNFPVSMRIISRDSPWIVVITTLPASGPCSGGPLGADVDGRFAGDGTGAQGLANTAEKVTHFGNFVLTRKELCT
ncbi:hypothetical protein PG994_006277 [Apiospora phragmitis]|uniref:Uncharacterized protein n=1 Tax=Apiospora phragmitis TaxID=2905665 RepID=A0ABR1VEL4_9PEZI